MDTTMRSSKRGLSTSRCQTRCTPRAARAGDDRLVGHRALAALGDICRVTTLLQADPATGSRRCAAGVAKIRGTEELDGDLDDAASPKGTTTPGSSLKADSAGAVSLADSEALVRPLHSACSNASMPHSASRAQLRTENM